MLHSMTAFARSQGHHERYHLVWELRSVNHRYLEAQFRVPDLFRGLEPVLREAVRKHLKRGKVDATLRVDKAAATGAFEVNRPLLLQLMATLEQVRRDAPDIGSVSALELMKWPGVLMDQGEADEALLGAAESLFEMALTDLIGHRAREGEAITDVLIDRLTAIESQVATVQHQADNIVRTLQERLRSRVADLQANVDPTRLEAEIALLAQKADIAEELDRLTIHVKEARAALRGAGPHGRRLDFLTQELNREANTLGAKSIQAETAQRAVDLKVIIEQIREQVQNIE